VATFREAPIDLDRSHCSREKGLPTQFTARAADRFAGPYPASLPNQPMKQGA
jgi:hypothetical protein